MADALNITSLDYSYPDGTPVLNGISLDIASGESVGLIGANGAGKTTLLLLICGLLTPSSGEISVFGTRLSKKAIPEIRKSVGLVFQNPDNQLFTTSVREDVSFGPRNLGLSMQDVEERVTQSLEQCGITRLADKAPYRLSDGEKRKSALASVLSMRPRLLLLDEPTATLDPRSRRQLSELLPTLSQTKLIASHDLELIGHVCDRVIVLSGGRIAAQGKAGDIVRDKALLEENGLM
ncbi:MAG: energy-coupling factor ABC transporter ATP-binding protein [Eubacteriales bacterium]